MTLQQACALIEALVGYEDVAEHQSRCLSPHAVTALKQHLGLRGLPMVSDVWKFASQGRLSRTLEMRQLAKLLVDVGETVLRHLGPEEIE